MIEKKMYIKALDEHHLNFLMHFLNDILFYFLMKTLIQFLSTSFVDITLPKTFKNFFKVLTIKRFWGKKKTKNSTHKR